MNPWTDPTELASVAACEPGPWSEPRRTGAVVGPNLAILLTALVGLVGLLMAAPATAGDFAGVSFSKSFEPATVGPGSVSTLTFSLSSLEIDEVTGLAFTDVLPPGLVLADPVRAVDDGCRGVLDAPAGGTTVTFTDGALGGLGGECRIHVDVTASEPGNYPNVSGDLTSSVGNAGNAEATLVVAADRPGLSKMFQPSRVQLGGRSTLTFRIDNTRNPEPALELTFDDSLPDGLRIADVANSSTTCGGVVVAPPGERTITFEAGRVAQGASCTVSVDVTASAVGRLDNRTGDLLAEVPLELGTALRNGGKASATLEVVAEELLLLQRFVDDPAFPGGTATVEFSLTHLDRRQAASGLTFQVDLGAALPGLAARTPLPTEPCGPGSTLTGTSLLTLTGGALGPGETCTFQVLLQVPADAPLGTFPSTTTEVIGQVAGETVVGAPATDVLVVDVFPVVTKTFGRSPVGAGGTVDMELSITNPSSSLPATDLELEDDLSAFLGGSTPRGLPLAACRGTVTSSTNEAGDVLLVLQGGALAPGETCDVRVPLRIPDGTPTGSYPNVTGRVRATMGDTVRTGPAARAVLRVVAPPRLTKAFLDDPGDPGDHVTLRFTLTHHATAPGTATDVAFTDDLESTLPGLRAVGSPSGDVCGPGSSLSGTSRLQLTGGTLGPGESCIVSVTLEIPGDAPPGAHVNVTGPVTATVAGETAVGRPATDDLHVSGLKSTKRFVGDPVLPGRPVSLRFTLTNEHPTASATDVSFRDDLHAVLPGLAAVGLPRDDTCGSGSRLVGDPDAAHLKLVGGALGPGESCVFEVPLQVPADADSATYFNFTGPVTATYRGRTATFEPMRDDLVVDTGVISVLEIPASSFWARMLLIGILAGVAMRRCHANP